MRSYEQITKELLDKFYLLEPLLFRVYCTYKRKQNKNISCPIRIADDVLEYNLAVMEDTPELLLYEEFCATMLHVIMHHTTQRKPDGCDSLDVAIAADQTITGFYPFKKKQLYPLGQLPPGWEFERYALYSAHIRNLSDIDEKKNEDDEDEDEQQNNSSGQDQSDQSGGQQGPSQASSGGGAGTGSQPASDGGSTSGGSGSGCPSEKKAQPAPGTGKGAYDKDNRLQGKAFQDYADAWKDNAFKREQVRRIVQDARLKGKNGWGSIAGNAIEQICANQTAKIDYRAILKAFSTSVVSVERCLTRTRPNRRFGWEQMGSRRKKDSSRILIAIDVSGSVDSESLAAFFGVVNRFFKYGKELEVIQFDWELKEVQKWKKAKPDIDIVGRGGTNFQPVIDYVTEKGRYYDGLLILTDGYAEKPKIPAGCHTKLCWVFESEDQLNTHKSWAEELGRCTYVDLELEKLRL